MNTTFTIVWFEDNDDWYKITEGEITAYLLKHNFMPEIVRFKSVDMERIDKECSTRAFDLILADLALLNGETTGTQAISALRKKQILADALFYSSTGIDRLDRAMKDEVLEGVYRSNRDALFFQPKCEALINKAIKRSEDIINIRGLLMDTVSEFDDKLREAIQKYLGIADSEKIEALNKFAVGLVTSQSDSNKAKAEKIRKDNDGFIITAFQSTFLLDSNKLSHIVNEIFKKEFSDIIEMREFYKNYNDIILTERNNLAHAKKEPEVNGAFYFEDQKTGEKIEYNAEKCSGIRASIIKYTSFIDKIIEYIK